jgi:CRISPR system Cascade subunit CasC
LRALAEAAFKVGPKGKQASFASRAYASFVMAERGEQQPRSLSVAFLRPVTGMDLLDASTKSLRRVCADMDRAYGPCAEARYTVDVAAGEGTIAGLLDFVGA